jgi:hypothetical protein
VRSGKKGSCPTWFWVVAFGFALQNYTYFQTGRPGSFFFFKNIINRGGRGTRGGTPLTDLTNLTNYISIRNAKLFVMLAMAIGLDMNDHIVYILDAVDDLLFHLV